MSTAFLSVKLILFHFDFPPVCIGGGAEPSAELAVEIGLAGKADLVHNVFHFHVCGFNEGGGVFQTLLIEIVVKIEAGLLVEHISQIGRMHIQLGSQRL